MVLVARMGHGLRIGVEPVQPGDRINRVCSFRLRPAGQAIRTREHDPFAGRGFEADGLMGRPAGTDYDLFAIDAIVNPNEIAWPCAGRGPGDGFPRLPRGSRSAVAGGRIVLSNVVNGSMGQRENCEPQEKNGNLSNAFNGWGEA